MVVRIPKLVQNIIKVWSKITDPSKNKRESNNARLRNKYATDEEFRKKCEAHRAVLKKKARLVRLKKLSKVKIEKEKCYFCDRKDKLIDQHHPDYTRPTLVIPLCKKCHARLHKLDKMKNGKTNIQPTNSRQTFERKPRDNKLD